MSSNAEFSSGLLPADYPDLVAMEGFADIVGFMDKYTVKITSAFADAAKTLSPLSDTIVVSSYLRKRLPKVDDLGLEEIVIAAPTGLRSMVLPYARTLEDMVEDYSDIYSRLYKPLEMYLKAVMGDPDQIPKIWTDKDLVMRDVKKDKKRLAKHFERKGARSSGSGNVPFSEAYATGTDFLKTADVISKVEKKVNAISIPKILRGEEDLSRMLRLFVEQASKDRSVVPTNRQAINKLAMAVTAAAEETEMLSALVYSVTVLQGTYDLAQKKLHDVV